MLFLHYIKLIHILLYKVHAYLKISIINEQILGVLSVEWINMQIDETALAAPYWINSYHGIFTHSVGKPEFKLVDVSSNIECFNKGSG